MEYIEQKINVLFENKINYQQIDKKSNDSRNSIINNLIEFFERLKKINGISLIIGNNGIGKTYLLEKLKDSFEEEKIKVNFIKAKNYNDFKTIKELLLIDSEIIIFDGLDEINVNIMNYVLEYILSIKNKKVIISSRRDFAQKKNLLDIKYNIYEISQLEDYKIDNILKENNLNKENFKNMYNLLKTPRFLIHLIDVKEIIKESDNLSKYDLLEMIINKHFDVLNERAFVKIEKNIHKKILQTLALIMMMTGKSNLTMEEFTTFLSEVGHLDIKSYILNKDIIESFLNNQILLNFGDLISFENKEIMEFLAAKEIYENNFSNKDLFNIVTINDFEINTLWFNTLSYLMCKSPIYSDLILNYLFNNLNEQDNLLDLLLNLDITFHNENIVSKNIDKFIFQYTKLYQYMSFYNDSSKITKILDTNTKANYKKLVDVLIKQKIEPIMTDFNIIFINNLLSCINYLLENFSYNKSETNRLKKYLIKNEKYYMQSDNFKVRYLYIYLHLFNDDEIDKLIENNDINNRLLSIFLYDDVHLNNLKKLDKYLNDYILNYKSKFDDHFILNDNLIIKFINDNYDSNRLKKLINSIENDTNIASFIHFLNSNNSKKIWKQLSKKSIVSILYNKIIKKLINETDKYNSSIREEILFDRRNGDALEKILKLCIKLQYITKENLNDNIFNSNYITQYIRELIIKIIILMDAENIKSLYEVLNEKNVIFNAWRLELNNEEKNKLEPQINFLFPDDALKNKMALLNHENKNYAKVEEILNHIGSAKNVYYKIDNLYELIKNEAYFNIIKYNAIMKNTLKSIVKEIELHIKNINVDKLIFKVDKNKKYTISYDSLLYSKAMFILSKMGYDINNYNNLNIILLNSNIDKIEPIYNENNYKILLDFVDKKDSYAYVKFYLYDVIEKLKNYNSNILFKTIFKWLDNMTFDEYQINNILTFLIDNTNLLSNNEIKKLKKFRKYKLGQDILIELGYESEIKNRINYIKQNFVFEGSLINIEENGNFEYSSGTYINSLSKIGINNIKYIYDILSFMFSKYNEGDYYEFSKYILNMVIDYINNNINKVEIKKVIDYIILNEKKNNNRYLYEICNRIYLLKNDEFKPINQIIKQYNQIITNQDIKIYSFDDLYNIVKDILNTNILENLLKMKFLEIFKDKETSKIRPLREETYQFLIGYELTRILIMKGFFTKVVYESTAFDKKRSDIQLISEGFINNIVIETKLASNSDLSNEDSIKLYIKNTLDKYKERFNSPKILFVIINQNLREETCKKKIDLINRYSNQIVDTVFINLKNEFK